MNKTESDIINYLLSEPYINQRILAEATNHSLGTVNNSIKNLIKSGYLDEEIRPTEKAFCKIKNNSPKNAIILAAGFGMRMVPINTQVSKGMLEVKGEPLIERTIKQLKESGINEIYIVVGFMKHQYEYLIDKYDVELIVNHEYSTKNNIHSLKCAQEHISNTYIIPCDIWCRYNPYSRYEPYSWYMVGDIVDDDSTVRINRKSELVTIGNKQGGNTMIGISYLCGEQAQEVKKQLSILCSSHENDNEFWEKTLIKKDKMIVHPKVVAAKDHVEINNIDQLHILDNYSPNLRKTLYALVCSLLGATDDEITNVKALKKCMTNRSYMFNCKNQTYILRIPGEGTSQLISRKEEAEVYNSIKDKGICDDIIYINPEKGYKLTRYIENARVCNPNDDEDLKICMQTLRNFHRLGLKVEHEFDIFEKINFYESLWNRDSSIYRDYEETKKKVFALKPFIEKHTGNKVLTHIDAVPDNFLITDDKIYLIDWEYSAMQDPHVDIAMFCIYSLYKKEQVDHLIDIYFEGNCDDDTRTKIYCYIAACGLLWSNWCEYKYSLGVEFGEYSLLQYRYAKDYYKIVCEKLLGKGESLDVQN